MQKQHEVSGNRTDFGPLRRNEASCNLTVISHARCGNLGWSSCEAVVICSVIRKDHFLEMMPLKLWFMSTKRPNLGQSAASGRDLFYGSHNPVFQRRWQPFHHSREGEEAGMLRIKAEYALNWFLMQFNLFNPKMLNMEREAPTPGILLTEVSNQKYLLTEHPRDSNKSPKFRQRWRREQKINHK